MTDKYEVVEADDGPVIRKSFGSRAEPSVVPQSGEELGVQGRPPEGEEAALDYVRSQFGVPAVVGMRVVVNGRPGEITGGDGQYLVVLVDGEPWPTRWHPTWNVEYLTAERGNTGETRGGWPTQDAAGNNLRHAELCAWRFGGECDCGPADTAATPEAVADPKKETHD